MTTSAHTANSWLAVLDADAAAAQPIATFEEEQLETMLQSVGGNAVAGPKGNLTLAGGRSATVFISIAFDRSSHIPDRLLHHVITTDSVAEGAVISTHYTTLHVLGPPLEGANWVADDGPSNDQDNHHRRGIFVLDGRAVISRRYAIDWEQIKDSATFSGDSRDVRSYFAYGRPVLAVANGRVVVARDGLPDNVPGQGESFHPAVPITIETVAGNTITLDLNGGQFAYYMHLQPGSLRVKAGDRVRRGQVLARIGSTATRVSRICISKSPLRRNWGLAKVCLISSTAISSRAPVAGLQNYAYTSCLWIITLSISGTTTGNREYATRGLTRCLQTRMLSRPPLACRNIPAGFSPKRLRK